MSAPPPDTGSAAFSPGAEELSRIRNVAVLGCAGGQASALIRDLARFAGADLDSHIGKGARLDTDLAAVTFPAGEFLLTLVDLGDVTGQPPQTNTALACDAVLMVASPRQPVPAAAVKFWDDMVERGIPGATILAITEPGDSGLDDALEAYQEALGESTAVLPLHLPLLSDDHSVAGLIDLLTLVIQDFSGPTMTLHPAEPVHLDLIDDYRRALAETVIAESPDDALLEAALQGDPVDVEALSREADSAIRRGRLHPLLVVATDPPTLGSTRVMDVITRAFPSPFHRLLPPVHAPDGSLRAPLTTDPLGPLCAEVLTVSARRGAHQCLIRIFSGTLQAGQQVYLHGPHPGGVEPSDLGRLAQVDRISDLRAENDEFIDAAGAGRIVAVFGLTGAFAGETISESTYPLVIEEPHSEG